MKSLRYEWALGLLIATLAGLLALTLSPYHWNPQALFHLDRETYKTYGAPSPFLVLSVPGYDGEQYYEIARHMGIFFRPDLWVTLADHTTIAYSCQRFLLPLLASALALTHDAWLPYSFLFINVVSLIVAFLATVWWRPRASLYGLAIALSPPALIGLHFSLAEPLTLAILTAFLIRFVDRKKLYTLDLVLLSLFVLAREVNILFIGVLLLYLLWNRRWQDCFLLTVPVLAFLTLHTLIFKIFHEVPFFWSTGKNGLPFAAIVDIIRGAKGYNIYTLSSIALFFLFVLPALLWSVTNAIRQKTDLFLPIATTIFLCVMLVMPDHIWGSITSIGRVITPVYPLLLLQAAERDTIVARLLAFAILVLGLAIGLSLASIIHPFTIV